MKITMFTDGERVLSYISYFGIHLLCRKFFKSNNRIIVRLLIRITDCHWMNHLLEEAAN